MIYTIIKKNRFGEVQQVISFSCVTDYSKSLSASVTSNPVENGRQISDGVVVDLPTFDISATISSYDIFDDNRELIWNGEVFAPRQPIVQPDIRIEQVIEKLLIDGEVFTLLVSEDNDRSSEASLKYENLSKSKYEEYNNCVLVNYSLNDVSGTKDVSFIKLSIKQLNIAFVRKDQLTTDEQQPSLQKVPRKQSTSGSVSSTTDTANTDTSNLGLEGKDAASKTQIAKPATPEDNATFKHIKSELDQERALNDANEFANQRKMQGYNSYVVPVLGGYEVRTK